MHTKMKVLLIFIVKILLWLFVFLICNIYLLSNFYEVLFYDKQ